MYDDGIQYEASYYDGIGTWISSTTSNGLYYKKKNSNISKLIKPFKEKQSFRLHGEAICVDGVIYFSPVRAEFLDFYDIKTGKIGKIDLHKNNRHFLYAMHIMQYNRKLYWADRYSDFMVYEYDIDKQKITTYCMSNVISDKAVIGMDMVLVNHSFYFVSALSNVILTFDAESHQFDRFIVESRNTRFNTICYDGKYFWLSGNECITQYDMEVGESKDYSQYPDGFGMIYRTTDSDIKKVVGFDNTLNEFPFAYSIANENGVFFFPYRTNMIIYLEPNRSELSGIVLQPETEESLLGGERSTHCRFIGIKAVDKNSIQCYSTYTSSRCVLDCKEKKLKIEKSVPFFEIIGSKEDQIILHESNKRGLKQFIEYILETNEN